MPVVGGQDGVGVVAGIAVDVRDGLIDAGHHLDADDGARYSSDQSASRAGGAIHQTWQRLRTVGKSADGDSVTSKNDTPAGGSSSTLRSALAVNRFIASAGTIVTTRRPVSARLKPSCKSRICSSVICLPSFPSEASGAKRQARG